MGDAADVDDVVEIADPRSLVPSSPPTELMTPIDLMRSQLAEERPYTLVDLSQRAGLSIATTRRLVMARGLSRKEFGPRDVTYLQRVKELFAFLPEDVVVRAARVRARALFQVLTSDLVLSRRHLLGPLFDSGATEEELLDVLERANEVLLPTMSFLLAEDYLAGIEDVLDNAVVQSVGSLVDGPMDLVIGFVDLVGYTSLSARIDPEGLDDVLNDFEDHVHSLVEAAEHVSIAKFIGDAAMLVGSDPTAVTDVVWEIVTSSRAEVAAAARRGAVTAGPVVVREGDYYGTPVNLAARLTEHARGGSVLTDVETGPRIDGFEQKRLSGAKLRGLGEMRPVLLSRG